MSADAMTTLAFGDPRLPTRFWAKIDRQADCWVWTASLNGNLGQFKFGAATRIVPRVLFEMVRGDVPAGLEVVTTCGVRSCCNPDHLNLISRSQESAKGELARFWRQVTRTDSCWLWTAGTNHEGYGYFCLANSGGSARAHRFAYEALVGPIPDGLTLDHLCRVRRCVNPAHLEPVTTAVNTQRGKAAVTHCPQGHPYDEINTYLKPPNGHNRNGQRVCRTCTRTRWSRKARQATAKS